MSKQTYTEAQIQELLSNKYVKKCTKSYITFTKECKYEVLKLSKNRYFYRDIFAKLWFPEYITYSQVPRNALKRWQKIVREKWFRQIEESKKWRKIKEKIDISQMSKEEYINYLEAKVAYLEELDKVIPWKSP